MTRIDVSHYAPYEATLRAVGSCFDTFEEYPIKLRANYQWLVWLMVSECKWVEFFEDERGTFLMVVTPAGRVQVVTDHSLPAGEGVLEFRDTPFHVLVSLAN